MTDIRPEHEPTARPPRARDRDEREKTARIVAGGSITEAVAGAGAVLLAILGLAGMLPVTMAAIATIAVGIALLAQGGAVAARWSRIARDAGYPGDTRVEMSGGVGAEVFGGATGIVLGVLALLGVLPGVLLAIALIAFGGALLLASGVTMELGSVGAGVGEGGEPPLREVSAGASGLQVLAGVGGVVLGILALLGGLSQMALNLILVGLLVVGGAVLLSGGAVGGRLLSVRRR